MRIDRLRLKNFRCFKYFDLELHHRVTLLVGTNGAGKSAVLDALAIAVGAWLSGTSQARREARSIVATDARLVRQEIGDQMTVNPVFPVRVEAHGRFELAGGQTRLPGFEDSSWARELADQDGRTSVGDAATLRDAAAWDEHQAAKRPEHPLPVLAYYGTGRLWVQKRDKTPEQRSRMSGYRACLEFASDHKLFEHWMADMEGARVQRLAAAQEAGRPLSEVRSPHLEAVQAAAVALLEGATRFFFSIAHQELRVVFEDGTTLPYTALSDGQRSLIMLAADLAWRCVQLNPYLGVEASAKTRGIVLIDEIELHLHPQWQRRVLTRITSIFPQVQFVIATHSPQVVSTAAPSWLRVVYPDGRWHGVDHTRGRDSNALLRDVFGTVSRPEFAREAIAQIERLIGEGNTEAARVELEALEQELGPDDDTLQGLMWELHDLELHGPLQDGEQHA
ncbi:MAG: AAA family ATPase [Alphaproteobacteria bacterium]|nr:AAA family ATPase [Alphaproteobacteria bacterium]